MTWKRVSVWLFAAIMTCAVCTTTADAAVVDKTAPFDGTYFMAYNASLGGSYSSGVMPKVEWAGEEEPMEDCVMGIDEDENGQLLYRIEPHGLSDRLQLPKKSGASVYKSPRRTASAQYGDERTFYAVHATTGAAYPKEFVLKYCGEYCNIWLEKDNPYGVTDENVTELGAEYDYNIHQRMQSAFGPIYDRDGDGKVAFLFYDIQDAYSTTHSGGYVAGFFMAEDLLGSEMNCMDVLHIDTYPSYTLTHRIDKIKGTMVHELQHLIESSAVGRKESTGLPIWANEGLSMAAEHMFFGPQDSRISYYNKNVAVGANLTSWDFETNASLSYYSMNYLFFQYLRTQTKDMAGGGEELYKYFISGEHTTGNPILDGIRQFYPYISWDDIIRNFYIALTLKESSGLYGFAGESWAKSIQTKLYTGTAARDLGPGAAIVKTMGKKPYTPSATGARLHFAAFTPGGTPGVDAPMASADGGETYKFKNIRLSCCERAATIYYTMDGSEPTPEHGLVYTGRPIPLLSNTTLKAVTYTPEGRKSQVSTYEYTIVKEDVELFRRVVSTEEQFGGGAIYDAVPAPEEDGIVVVGSWRGSQTPEGEFCDLTSKGNAGEAYLAKYDWNGNCVWIRSYCFDEWCRMYGLLKTEDGYILCGGSGMQTQLSAIPHHTNDLEGYPLGVDPSMVQAGRSCAIIAKVDFYGNLQWAAPRVMLKGEIDGISERQAYYKNIFRMNTYRPTEGTPGYVGVGITGGHSYNGEPGWHINAISTNWRGYVIKVDEQGQVCWETYLAERSNLQDIVALTDDTVVAVGMDVHGALLIALDGETGEILWQYTYKQDGMDYAGCYFGASATDDGLIAVGSGSNTEVTPITRFRADRESCELVWAIPDLWATFAEAIVAEDGKSVMVLGSWYGGELPGYGKDPSDAYKRIVAIKLDMKDGAVSWVGDGVPNYGSNYGYIPNGAIYLGSDRYAVVGNVNTILAHNAKDNGHGFISVFLDESTDYYTVSGQVTGAGDVGLPGALVGGKMTDSQGNFSLRVKEGETVTLIPTLAGYTFEPASIPVGPLSGDSEGNNFAALEKKYTVSGLVRDVDGNPLPGVAIRNSAGVAGVVTDAAGAYSFYARPNITLTLTPELEGHTFEPAQRTINALSGDTAGQDFREIPVRYTVSGTVTRGGVGQGGVLVCEGVLTDGDGNYTITVEKGQNVILKPSFFRYVFAPTEATLTDISEDGTQDFTMELGSALLVVSPVSKDFGKAYPGYEPIPSQIVRITNAGGEACSGLAVTASGSSFDVVGPEIAILNGGESTTFTVAPKQGLGIGSYSETVTIRSGELSKTVEVTFAVEKVPTPAALEIEPAEWNFGTTEEWYAPIDRASIIVRNTGGSPCEGLTVQLQEDSAFLIPRRLSGTLAGGGAETFLLKPRDDLTQGEYEETVTVTNGTVSAQMQAKFVVTKGADPARLVFEPAELDFGRKMEGYAPLEPVTVKIKNVGGLPCSRLTVGLSEKKVNEEEYFELTSDLNRSTNLPGGEYVTFTVKPKDDLEFPIYSSPLVVDGVCVYEDTITVANQNISATMKVKFKLAPFHEPTQLKTDPDPVDFGKVCLGYEPIEEKYVMVYNVGEHYCANATASLKDGTAFEITGQELRYLDPDPNYGNRGSVALKPKDGLGVGVYEDTMIIADDATYHEVSVKFEVGTATLDVDPISYEFPSAYEGDYWSYELETGISATNNGTLTCSYPNPYFENGENGFKIESQTIYDDLPGGKTDIITVAPVEGLEVGTYEDTLVVEIYTPDYIWLTKSVPLKFTVLEPPAPAELKFEPERIDFGPYQVGYDPVEPVTFTVTNIGGVDCPDPQFDYAPSYFDLELVGELDLSAGGVTTVRIKPKDGLGKINLSADVSFWDEFDPYDPEDDLSAYLPISLTITEEPVLAPKLEVTPTSYTFESKKAEYEAVTPVTFTVKNPGTAACTGLKGELQENSHFEFVKAVPDSVAAGGEGTFTLRPKAGLAPGTYTETVTVTNSTLKKELTVTFVVTEKPEEPGPTPTAKLEVTPESYTFEGKEEGYEAVTPATFTVKNPGTAACTGLKGELQASSKFEFVKAVPGSVAAGGDETFTLRPKTGLDPGTYTEKVTVTNGTLKKELTVTFVVTEKPGETEPGGEDKPDKPGGEDKPDKPDKPGGEDKPDKPGEENKPDTPSGGEDKPTPRPPAGSSSDGDGDGGNGQPPAKTEEKPVLYEEHLPYITGFKDGTFRSEASLTRGQCAAILSRLSDDFDPQKTYGNHFPDVAENSWYINYVGYLTEKNVIRGYPDGTFRPDEPITRAEFVALLGQGLGLEKAAENPYPDCGRHWASGSIARLTEEGVLNGYPDGSFRPDIPISRSEAVKAVNKAYHRSAEDGKLKVASPFTDVDISNWAYYEILEAAIEHRVEK